MADIELVIKIPKDRYKEIISGIFDADGYFKTNLTLAFRNGIPLRKGHGKLIDAKAYEQDIHKHYFDNESVIRCTEIALSNALAIIEADKPQKKAGIPCEENDSGYNCENWIP